MKVKISISIPRLKSWVNKRKLNHLTVLTVYQINQLENFYQANSKPLKKEIII